MMEPPVDPVEQEQVIREVGMALLGVAPVGWQEMEFSFRSTVVVDTATLWWIDPNGERFRLDPPNQAMDLLSTLRPRMYVKDRGSWFTARMKLRPPGRYEVEYDYDGEPEFTPPLSPDVFALDFRHFPRSEENTPEWLRQKVAEDGASPHPS